MNTYCVSSKIIYTSVKKNISSIIFYQDFSHVLITFLNVCYDVEYTYKS